MRQVCLTVSVLLFSGILLAAPQERAPKANGKPVCEASFTIPAHSVKTCTFIVPESEHRARLVGNFRATGGLRNSIEVWVMNDDEFVNWQNHHPVNAIYNSQKVTQGTVKAFLPDPGKYHVVFNNDFSVLTPKAVEVQLAVEYQ